MSAHEGNEIYGVGGTAKDGGVSTAAVRPESCGDAPMRLRLMTW